MKKGNGNGLAEDMPILFCFQRFYQGFLGEKFGHEYQMFVFYLFFFIFLKFFSA